PDFRRGQTERLHQLQEQTAAALQGQTGNDPIFEALRRVVERNAIPARHPQELLAGFAMDAAQRGYHSVSDTLDYCYHVAGVVGVMMAMIMGAREGIVLDRASDLGIAFQLTNIARDVIEDARAGRVYLPGELLARHGITTVDPDNPAQRAALHRAALELLDLAERYYASAAVGMAALPPRSAWAIAAARRVYRAIGTQLRQGGPEAWNSRVSTSGRRKAMLVLASLADVAASRLPHTPSSREGLWQRP
ncbi:MAG: Phytoene synthase, partial [Devosia sp.]|nr:Phytoene synthase [Devosia sp.]